MRSSLSVEYLNIVISHIVSDFLLILNKLKIKLFPQLSYKTNNISQSNHISRVTVKENNTSIMIVGTSLFNPLLHLSDISPVFRLQRLLNVKLGLTEDLF